MSDPRIAWFSPLQPVESGISLYSEDLLPVLSESLDIDVFVDGYSPSNLRKSSRLRVASQRMFNSAEYDLAIYQIGNSPAHLSMLPEVAKSPGLLVLHDTVLNHLFIQQAARDGTLHEYRQEMYRRYGPEGAMAADRVLKGQAPDDLFRFPMSESLVRASRATLVHSEFARRAVLQRSPDATVFRAPLGLTLPDFVDRSRARAILRIPDDQFLIASITHISPYKRIDVVLRAFRQLRNSTPARLILAGSVSPNFPLFRMVAHLGLDQVVDTPGYVSDQDARLIAAAADVIVNLRYPTAGETSASLLHSMAAGRPVLVSETGSFTEVPADAVIRIPVDALEESMLLAILRRLAEDKQLAEAIGRRARDYVETRHSMQRWVNGYCEAIEAITGMEVRRPVVENHYEAVITGRPEIQHYQTNELTREIARDIAELGLGADEDLMSEIARAHVELGLGVGMISEDP